MNIALHSTKVYYYQKKNRRSQNTDNLINSTAIIKNKETLNEKKM